VEIRFAEDILGPKPAQPEGGKANKKKRRDRVNQPRKKEPVRRKGGRRQSFLWLTMKRRHLLIPAPVQQKLCPERTCIAAVRLKSKRELVRIVKTKDEGIVIDTKG